MNAAVVHETREKLLIVAKILFAKNGFEGTSIRDIASAADVNVAAINYHFKNKQGLYFEIFKTNCAWMEERLSHLRGDGPLKTSEFVKLIYQFFIDERHALLISFKMILEDFIPLPENTPAKELEDIGPPGGRTLLSVITDEVGEKIPLQARQWAMRMIFNQVVHCGVVMNTSVVKAHCEVAQLGNEEIKRNLSFHVAAILEYIIKNPQQFG